MSMKKTLHYPYIYISSSKTTSKKGEGNFFFWCHHQHRIFLLTPANTQLSSQLSNLVPSSSRPEPEPEHLSLPSNPRERQGGGGKSRGNDEGKDSGDKGESSSSALELARCQWMDGWMDTLVGWFPFFLLEG